MGALPTLISRQPQGAGIGTGTGMVSTAILPPFEARSIGRVSHEDLAAVAAARHPQGRARCRHNPVGQSRGRQGFPGQPQRCSPSGDSVAVGVPQMVLQGMGVGPSPTPSPHLPVDAADAADSDREFEVQFSLGRPPPPRARAAPRCMAPGCPWDRPVRRGTGRPGPRPRLHPSRHWGGQQLAVVLQVLGGQSPPVSRFDPGTVV